MHDQGRRIVSLPLIAPDPEIDRPRTRADCVNGPRPCPFVSCRHHLALEVDSRGTLWLRDGGGAVRRDADPSEVERVADEIVDQLDGIETCSLDVADSGERDVFEIARVLGVSAKGQRVRQVLERALVSLHAGRGLDDVIAD